MAKRIVFIFRRGAAAMQNEIIQNQDVPGVSTFLYRTPQRFPTAHVTAGETTPLAGVTNGYACSTFFQSFHQRWKHPSFRVAAYFAIGNDNPTRSHFYEQDRISGGGFNYANQNSGFYNRWAGLVSPTNPVNPLDLISVGQDIARSVIGVTAYYAATRTGQSTLNASAITRAAAIAALPSPIDTGAGVVLKANQLAIRNTHEALVALGPNLPAQLPSQIAGAGVAPQYLGDRFGTDMSVTARLIAAGVTTRVFVINADYPWDTHVNMMGSPNSPAPPTGAAGHHHTMLLAYDQNTRAFLYDLEALGEAGDTLIVSQTEFHRTQRQNGSLGTDHGHAGHAYIWSRDVISGLYAAQTDFTERPVGTDPFADPTTPFTNPGPYQSGGSNRFFKYTFEYRDFQRMQLEWLMGRRMTSQEVAAIWGPDFISNPPSGEYNSLSITPLPTPLTGQ